MSATTGGGRTVWERVREDAEELAAELQADGWQVCVVQAGHVAAVPPSASTDRHGLVYIVPDSVGEELPELVDESSFDRYEVFRTVAGNTLYLVIRVRDDETERGVVLSGAIDVEQGQELADAARERDELHSHVRLLDGTHLATFRHEDPTHFFPEER